MIAERDVVSGAVGLSIDTEDVDFVLKESVHQREFSTGSGIQCRIDPAALVCASSEFRNKDMLPVPVGHATDILQKDVPRIDESPEVGAGLAKKR